MIKLSDGTVADRSSMPASYISSKTVMPDPIETFTGYPLSPLLHESRPSLCGR